MIEDEESSPPFFQTNVYDTTHKLVHYNQYASQTKYTRKLLNRIDYQTCLQSSSYYCT